MNCPALVTYRGSVIENTHMAHIAVVDRNGELLYRFGDPTRMTLARSAAKPAQALAILETGALDEFDFEEADLALMCASHNSEEKHIERTRSMLKKVGAKESELRCGGHAPLSDAVAQAWMRHGFEPTAVCSNCSGKHVGMLAGARSLGVPAGDYHHSSHPMQQRVRRVVTEVCALLDEGVEWATDGCNLPTPAFPLDRLARLYANLAHGADMVSFEDVRHGGRLRDLARIYRAMTRHPEMVAGTGRFCTSLMQAFDGQLVGKLGADACYGLGVRRSGQTVRLGVHGAIGIAVKVEDGNISAMYSIVCEVLDRLEIGTPSQRALLKEFHRPRIANTRDFEVGHVAFPFELERC